VLVSQGQSVADEVRSIGVKARLFAKDQFELPMTLLLNVFSAGVAFFFRLGNERPFAVCVRDFGMSANRLRYRSLVLAAFLIVGSGHYAGAQPLGVNPSAAPSDIGNPSSINPAARASDIRNPSAINPAGAASQIPRSSAVSPTSPAQAMPRVARQRIALPPRRAPCSSAHAPRPCHGNPGRATTDTCGAKSYVEERTGHFASTLEQEAEVEQFRD
jgi:hypothetical protein